MSILSQAYDALDSDDLPRATALFSELASTDPGGALRGIALVHLHRGELRKAEEVLRGAIGRDPTPATVGLLADVVGRAGRRDDAQHVLEEAIASFPRSGYLRAVLGEQYIRRSKWDHGTDLLIEGLGSDSDTFAYQHVARVVRDLVDAHRVGKIPKDKAMRLVNRLDYGGRRDEQDLPLMLAAARRALNGRSRLEFPVNLAPRPRGESREAASPPPPPPPRSSAATAPPEPPRLMAEPTRVAKKEPPPPPIDSIVFGDLDDVRAGGGAGRGGPMLAQLLSQDRRKNQALQDLLDPIGLPAWPSSARGVIDDIPVMRPAGLGAGSETLRRTLINITSGDVRSEIVVARAVEQLIASVRGSCPDVAFDETGLTRVELALSSGALERMEPISAVYLAESGAIDPSTLALGGFLGECITRRGGTTWTFDADASRSTVESVRGADYEPMALARQWVAASDKDDVNLRQILTQARRAGDIAFDTLIAGDPTEGLSGRALSMKLADQWTQFWQQRAGDTFIEIAETIRPLNELPAMIVFAVAAEFAPALARGPGGEGAYRGEVALAYVRRTGEFLCLASRQHFARAMELLLPKGLTAQSTGVVLHLFSAFHRPRVKLVTERTPGAGPTLSQAGRKSVLEFHDTAGARRWALVHSPEALIPWTLQQTA